MTWGILIAAYGAAAFVGARGWRQAGCLVRHWASAATR
jgi:hypothetical protein